MTLQEEGQRAPDDPIPEMLVEVDVMRQNAISGNHECRAAGRLHLAWQISHLILESLRPDLQEDSA